MAPGSEEADDWECEEPLLKSGQIGMVWTRTNEGGLAVDTFLGRIVQYSSSPVLKLERMMSKGASVNVRRRL